MFSLPVPPPPPAPPITYPWTYDEDVIATKASIKEGEKLTGSQLSDAAAQERSMDMIDSYDNNRRVWERNMPYGNQWGVLSVTGRTDTAPTITSPPQDKK
tara:strand:- start:184 stop:483 length:300 start_codon:yes stop_codon:yes gene_type:complete